MADNIQTVGINVTDNGTTEALTKKVQSLKSMLDQVSTHTGGTAGSNSVAAGSREEGRAYAANRAVGTGSSGTGARNFAAESQGLGGVVRLYATLAANIFAVGAAFRALSEATNTAHMVQGLDQLGAASGRNLGTLSKQLIDVTGGALSLRDAMQAVAQQSAAGIGTADILKLGQVARLASQALGRDMVDAVNRLSLGIAKQEPRLLDELGILVRVNKAHNDYALSIGKSASSLTDFEKKQGFTNAALDQGMKKFKDINIDTNPYNKLTASIENLMSSGLNLVNKVLGPMVSMLSESPIALAAILGLIAKTLVGQAVPAISAWRAGLNDAAQAARDNLAVLELQRVSHRKTVDTYMADRTAALFNEASNKLSASEKLITGSARGKTLSLIPKTADIMGDNQSNLDAIEAHRSALIKQQNAIEKRNATSPATIAAQKAEIEGIKAYVKVIDEYTPKFKNYLDVHNSNVTISNSTSMKQQADQIHAQNAAMTTTRIGIVADTSKTFDSSGFKEGWAVLNAKILDARTNTNEYGKTMGMVTAGLTRTVGTLTLLAGAFSAVTTVVMPLIQLVVLGIAAVVAVYEGFSWALSTNSKQAEEASKSFDTLTTSIEFTDKVISSISKKDPLESISTESIVARATALRDLAVNAVDTVTKATEALNKASRFNIGVNWFKSLFNQDILSTEAEKVALAVSQALKVAQPGKITNTAKASLDNILGMDSSNMSAVEAKLKTSPALLKEVSDRLNKFGLDASNAASYVKQLDDDFTALNKTYDTILISNIPTDNMAKLGTQTIAMGVDMAKALDEPISALHILADVSGDISKLRLFSPEASAGLIMMAAQTKDLVVGSTVYNKLLDETNAKIKQNNHLIEANKKEEALLSSNGKPKLKTSLTHLEFDAIKATEENKGLEEQKKGLQAGVDYFNEALKPAQAILRKGLADSFVNGTELITKSITGGFALAAISIQTALSHNLGDTSAAIALRATLQKEAIDVQIAHTSTTLRLINVTEALRIVQEAAIDQAKKKEIEDKPGVRSAADAKTLVDIDLRAKVNDILAKGSHTPKALSDLVAKGGTTDASEETVALATAAKAAMPSALDALASKTAIAKENAQKTVITITAANQQLAHTAAIEQQVQATKLDQLNTSKHVLNNQTQGLAYLDEATIKEVNRLDTLTLINKHTQENNALQLKVDQANSTFVNPLATTDQKEAAAKSKVEYAATRARLDTTQAGEKERHDSDMHNKGIANDKARYTAGLSLLKINFDTDQGYENTLMTIKEENLAKLANLGALTPEAAAVRQVDLDQEKESLRNKKALFDIAQAQSANYNIYSAAKDQGGDKAKAAEELYGAQTAATASAIQDEGLLHNARKATLEISKEQKIAIDQQSLAMRNLVDVTTSLGIVFGKVGTSVGTALQGIAKISATEQNYALARKVLDSEKIKDTKAIAALDTKYAKDQLTNIGNIAGATKGVFAEKTLAHKMLAGVEKAMHIVSMAMTVEKMIVDGAWTAESIANSFERAGADGIAAVIKTLAGLPPPMNFIAGAAMAAVVASLLGGAFSGGSVSMPGGFSAADQQKAQGTGQSWVGGKLVDNGGGDFGDSSAKSKSIDNSITLMEDHAFKNLDYSNKMLDALKAIKENTGNLGKTLVRISGLTSPGESIKSGNWLFGNTSSETVDKGIQVHGTIGQAIAGTANVGQYTKTKDSDSGFLGFIGGGTSYNTNVQSMKNQAVTEGISSIFSTASDALVEAGKKFGKDSVAAIVGGIDISESFIISTMGLKGQELVDAITSSIGIEMDRAALKAFPELEQFRKMGEGMSETVIRVIDSNSKIQLAFESTGKITGKLSAAATENLAKLAGGSTKFLDQVQAYSGNFLTAADKLIPVQAAVVKQMGLLGLASTTTKDQFNAVVNALDMNSLGGRKLYVDLMNVQDGFNMVAQAAEATAVLDISLMELQGNKTGALAARRAIELKALSATDAAIKRQIFILEDQQAALASKNTQDQKIYTLQNKLSLATARAREVELAGMQDNLKASQRYIYALEDEATARDAATKAVTSTISSLKGSLATLTTYRDSLLTSSSGVLTPEQKYNAFKEQLLNTKTAASAKTDTPAELAAQQAAAAKLPQAATDFLSASKVMNASSEQYVQDLSRVQQLVSDTISSVSATLTTAEQQLVTLNTMSSALANIDASTVSTAQLMSAFLSLVGISKGLVVDPTATTKVPAETGVSIKDDLRNMFKNPSPGEVEGEGMYPNSPPTGTQIAVNDALVAQLVISNKLLQQQLDDAKVATIAMIKVNADVVAAQTAALVKAQQDAVDAADWQARMSNREGG